MYNVIFLCFIVAYNNKSRPLSQM